MKKTHFVKMHGAGNDFVLVDDRVRVVHPRGSGYSNEAAEEQMWRWFATLPDYVSQELRTLRDPVEYRK